MKRLLFLLLLILTFLISACAPSVGNTDRPLSEPSPVTNNNRMRTTGVDNADLARTDEQGAVVFAVTPLNLETTADTLEFDVAMNTHSVDLSMDLATLSTLSTDTGLTIQATKWDATPGGHHVSGKLIFPASANGKSILEDAKKLTLTIANVDAASRVFEWELK
ncbi:MAG TPA: hypothetical protein VK206_22175 [Anaerolineales bacterium]|nr:hypothetical protein [Anaerolineales bacterium]